MYTNNILEHAKTIFDFLYLRDAELHPVDIIIGFGHFDMRIPRKCGQLYEEGYSRRILFTGGRGAGTADLPEAEGVEFERELLRKYPKIPSQCIIVESESTNTGENISFSERILESNDREFCFIKGIDKAIAVACPYRQLRVKLCMNKLFPGVELLNAPPDTTFEYEMELYKSKNQNFILLLAGEMERILTYPKKGFILQTNIPEPVYASYHILKEIPYL